MYGIVSDTHCHNWTQFFKTDENGVNSRLKIILNEIERCANEVKARGGEYLFHAGDLFHVRGMVAPSVLNPTIETFKKIVDMGIKPVIICGNHDAEFRDTNDLGSAIGALAGIGCKIVNKPCLIDLGTRQVLCTPWYRDNKEFLETVHEFMQKATKETDLICHIALNGVFSHLEASTCVDPNDVLKAGQPLLKRIFAGHLHFHKELQKDVFSIGAICHHNWGDVDSLAGFLLVEGGNVEFVESNAPKFVFISNADTDDVIKAKVKGNYVKANVTMTEAQVKKFRAVLEELGALGVTLILDSKVEVNASRMQIQTSESIETIVARYIDQNTDRASVDAVKELALEILSSVEL